MKLFGRISLIVLLAIVLLAVALYVPTSLPVNTDFSAIYNTDLALVHHIPIYDLSRVQAYAAPRSGIPPEKFFLARFPYPPWYALSTFYLGLLPIKAAATLWFELNLVMLFLSVWLLTDGWSRKMRLAAFPLALIFIPVAGALTVGQYDFPVLLGTAVLIHELQRHKIGLVILGMVLLTFKPHVGGLILLAALIWLITHKSGFRRKVWMPLGGAALFLILFGFLADPAWIVSYPRMLLNYQNEGNVAGCTECVSLPVWLSRHFFNGSLMTAAWIALGLLVVLAVLFYFLRYRLALPEDFLSTAVFMTLLASPYLYNYDYLLLLIPLAVFFRHTNLLPRLLGLIGYLIPTLAILLFGRGGNITLILVTAGLGLLFTLQAGKPSRETDPAVANPAPQP